MNGTHRPDGLCIAADRDSAEAFGLIRSAPQPALVDVAPAVLRVLGIERGNAAAAGPDAERIAYTPEQEALVAARLRALGYLD